MKMIVAWLVLATSATCYAEDDSVSQVADTIDAQGYIDLEDKELMRLARRYIWRMKRRHKERIEVMEEYITKLTRQTRTERDASAEKKRERGKELRKLRAEIKALKATTDPMEMDIPFLKDYNTGDIGMTKYVARVFQVVGENDMLVKIDDVTYWVSGDPTKGIADGDRLRLSYVFVVGETKTYTTAIGGSKTVVTLNPFLYVGE